MRYKCLDCGHEFEGSSYTTECPECGSTNIVQIYSDTPIEKLKKWIKENKLISCFILIILILILVGQCEKPPDTIEKEIYSLDFDQSNKNYCIVYLEDSEGNRVNYSERYNFLNLEATIDDENGDTYTLNIKDNKIYYCTRGEVTVNYKTESSDGNQKLDAKFVRGEQSIPNVNPNNPKKNCTPHIEINDMYYDQNTCEIVISLVKGKSHAYISITGKDGNFKKSSRFDIDGINEENFDIWYYAKGFKEGKKEYKDKKQKKKILKEIEGHKKNNSKGDGYSNDIIDKIKQDIKSILTNLQNKNYDKAEELIEEAATLYIRLNDKEAFKIGDEFINVWAVRTHVQMLHDAGEILNFKDFKIEIKRSTNTCNPNPKINVTIP